MCRERARVFNQISTGSAGILPGILTTSIPARCRAPVYPGGKGGIDRCWRFRKMITAMTHAVQVGNSSTSGTSSKTNEGNSSQ